MKKTSKILISLFILLLVVILIKPTMRLFFPYEYGEIIEQNAKLYDLDPLLISALIKTESNYDPGAISNKNANGLMQITTSTGEWIAEQFGDDNFTKESLHNPAVNIKYGVWYLDSLIDEFGSIEVALAAYNGGRGNVNKWLANQNYSKDGKTLARIPFEETDKYVKRVTFYYNIYKVLYR